MNLEFLYVLPEQELANSIDRTAGKDEIEEAKLAASETTKMDGDWTAAKDAMNAALESYDWKWTIDATNTRPLLKKKETNWFGAMGHPAEVAGGEG